MDGGASAYFFLALTAAGTATTAIDTVNSNKERQRILDAELRSNELVALDEENQRLQLLREANEEILANAGGVDAYASPSLIAARDFNFKMGMQDIDNIRLNLAGVRAGISARIGILKANSRATITSGIFQVAGLAMQGKNQSSLLKKTETQDG